jgi:hypothetical protein
MASELCKGGSYDLQCFPKNDPGVPFSVLVSTTGSHRTTGYRAFFVRANDAEEMPTLALHHERTEQPDLEMMAIFQVAFAFESPTDVAKVKIIDAKGEHVIEIRNLPTLIATCPA